MSTEPAPEPDTKIETERQPDQAIDREALIARFEPLLPGQTDLAEELLRRYSEPHRKYHTVAHLAKVLDWVDRLKVSSHDLYPVRLAAWFHDSVYQLKGAELTNEEASARLANRELSRRGLEQEDLNEVSRLVRLTETHYPGPNDKNGELLCDADLAILGADVDEYQRYRDEVRAEYAAVEDYDFAVGRLIVLQRFGGRNIFRTTAGRRLNDAAQSNLEHEALELIARYDLKTEGWPLEEEI